MDSEPGMRSIQGYKQLPHSGEMGSELGDNCTVVEGRDSENLSWEENEIFKVEIVSLRLSL